ncbi:GntR family transcriptional regulator [Wenxinia marina]|nr:GntR family transcriptional regulator [Wenxinia marina]
MIEHLTIRERTYNALLEMITNRELQVGQVIDEVSLARMLNVSRTPLREAIRQLVIEGLVTARPYRGHAIRSLTTKELNDLYSVRKELEVLAIRGAVPRMTDEDIAELEGLLDRGVQALRNGDLPAYANLDKAFHGRIAELSDNGTIVETLNRLALQIQLCRVMANEDPALAEHAAEEREAMVQAFRARDVDRAGELMRAHIAGVQKAAVERMEAAEPAIGPSAPVVRLGKRGA